MQDGGSIAQLIAQIGLSAVFLWLYLRESSAHDKTRTEKDALLEARRLDAVETRDKVTDTLSGISQTLGQINDKIVISKGNQGN